MQDYAPTVPDYQTAMIRTSRLGVQAHCLRFEIQRGLEPTLARMAELGFSAIELVNFNGCRGNPWGDFGAAADRSAAEIGQLIRDVGLQCPSVMVSSEEIRYPNLSRTIQWVCDTGATNLVLTSLPTPGIGSLQDWTETFAGLNELGATIRQSGLDFVIHTQPGLWTTVGAVRLADKLLETIDSDLCKVEFDPAGAIIYGADASAYLQQRAGAFFALHLRDGLQPPQPVFYLASEPLGQRYLDWRSLLLEAGRSGVQWYFVEMEMNDPAETLPAITASLQFLRSQRLLDSSVSPSAHKPISRKHS